MYMPAYKSTNSLQGPHAGERAVAEWPCDGGLRPGNTRGFRHVSNLETKLWTGNRSFHMNFHKQSDTDVLFTLPADGSQVLRISGLGISKVFFFYETMLPRCWF